MRKLTKRLLIAGIVVLLLHLAFFLGVAPYWRFETKVPAHVNVVEISQKQLAKIKDRIRKEKQLIPLLKQELHKEYETKTAPKNAQMIAPFNQTVPKQEVAGPQARAPHVGGGTHGASRPRRVRQARRQPAHPRLKLSRLGFAQKPLPEPIPPRQPSRPSVAGPTGPSGIYTPVGRDNKKLQHGNQNLLNAIQNKYYSFFERFDDPIIQNWYFLVRSNMATIESELRSHNIHEGAELPVTIEITMGRDGSFYSVRILESSGIPTFDRVTRQAVAMLRSLPNPPPGLFHGKQYYTRDLRFALDVNGSSLIQSSPDIYW